MADLTPPRFARPRQREALTRFEALAPTSRSFSGAAWGREDLAPKVPVRCGAEPCAPAGAADGEARQ